MSSYVNGAVCEVADQCVLDSFCDFFSDCSVVEIEEDGEVAL